MADIEPVDAALDAIAAHFQTALASHSLTALRGFPEANKDLDLQAGPVLTVTGGSGDEEACSPNEVDRTSTQVLYRIGYLTVPVQLDLWCRSRALRDRVGIAVREAFHNRLPWTAGLYLTSSRYHNRPIDLVLDKPRAVDDDGDSASARQWRATWMCTVTTDVVQLVTMPILTEAIVEVETDVGGTLVTDTQTVTPD